MKSITHKTETRKTMLFVLFVVLVLAMLSLESRADHVAPQHEAPAPVAAGL